MKEKIKMPEPGEYKDSKGRRVQMREYGWLIINHSVTTLTDQIELTIAYANGELVKVEDTP